MHRTNIAVSVCWEKGQNGMSQEKGIRRKEAGQRCVRITRNAGQSLVLSSLWGGDSQWDATQVEVRVSQVCADGTATLEVVLPDSVFVERKETLDGVRALFPRS